MAKEDSDCCERMCCPGDCRSYSLKLTNILSSFDVLVEGHRAFKCTCLWYSRPKLLIYEGKDKSKLMGKIVDKFSWCKIRIEIQDGLG